MDICSLFSLSGKTALVTGGSKGIGAMIAKGFISAGCKVYICSCNYEDCRRAVREICEDESRCIAIVGDVSNSAGIKQLVHDFSRCEDSLDILVNNTGAVWCDRIDVFPEEGWDTVLNTNLKAVFFLTQALLPLLKISATLDDPSRIINISSIAAKRTSALHDYSYSVSKAGMNQLTRVLAKELSEFNINANAITPGFFETAMSLSTVSDHVVRSAAIKSNPVPRAGRASDMAGIAIYMASNAGAYMTGDVVTIDGGRSLY